MAASDRFQVSILILYQVTEAGKYFSVNFAKLLRTNFERTSPDDFLWYLSVHFQNISFIESLWGTAYLMYKFVQFHSPDTVKNCFTGAFQVFYRRTRSGDSKAFICLKFLKIIN